MYLKKGSEKPGGNVTVRIAEDDTDRRKLALKIDGKMVQGAVRQVKAEHTTTHAAAKEKQRDEVLISHLIENQ